MLRILGLRPLEQFLHRRFGRGRNTNFFSVLEIGFQLGYFVAQFPVGVGSGGGVDGGGAGFGFEAGEAGGGGGERGEGAEFGGAGFGGVAAQLLVWLLLLLLLLLREVAIFRGRKEASLRYRRWWRWKSKRARWGE